MLVLRVRKIGLRFSESVFRLQYHLIGTAGMGEVVDERLRVKSVKSLRVVDASVFPHPEAVEICVDETSTSSAWFLLVILNDVPFLPRYLSAAACGMS
jgi:hypothetical protein